MADNVAFQTLGLATPPNATTVATDQLAGGEHVQFFKLMDGTLDGTSKATVGANGLYVELRPGTSLIGTMKLSDGVDTALVSAAGELSVDNSDRPGRLLGIIANLPAALAAGGGLKVEGVAGGVAQPVSGAFFQATQPVSLAAAVDVSDRAARLVGRMYGSQGQQLLQSPTNFNLVAELAVGATLIDPRVLQAGTAIIGSVKITDGVDTGLVSSSGMFQYVKNTDVALRVNKSIKFNSAAAPIADTLCSCVLNTDGVDAAGATTFAVTAGKRFRVLGIKLSVRTTTAATPWGELTVRMNPSGAAVIGSPFVHRLTVGGTAAVIGNVAADYYFFPEGWELSGTQQIGISFANNVATNVTDLVLWGYEYTP